MIISHIDRVRRDGCFVAEYMTFSSGSTAALLVPQDFHSVEYVSDDVVGLLPAVGAVRNFGPTSWQVADMASGRIDAFWEYGRDAGNLLGASVIAREAGVVVTDTWGRPWQAGSDSFLAAPSALHARLVDLLSGTVKS
jgi:fructose-1,6-bisphosphatase/inositol monophosphatase family enzyme